MNPSTATYTQNTLGNSDSVFEKSSELESHLDSNFDDDPAKNALENLPVERLRQCQLAYKHVVEFLDTPLGRKMDDGRIFLTTIGQRAGSEISFLERKTRLDLVNNALKDGSQDNEVIDGVEYSHEQLAAEFSTAMIEMSYVLLEFGLSQRAELTAQLQQAAKAKGETKQQNITEAYGAAQQLLDGVTKLNICLHAGGEIMKQMERLSPNEYNFLVKQMLNGLYNRISLTAAAEDGDVHLSNYLSWVEVVARIDDYQQIVDELRPGGNTTDTQTVSSTSDSSQVQETLSSSQKLAAGSQPSDDLPVENKSHSMAGIQVTSVL